MKYVGREEYIYRLLVPGLCVVIGFMPMRSIHAAGFGLSATNNVICGTALVASGGATSDTSSFSFDVSTASTAYNGTTLTNTITDADPGYSVNFFCNDNDGWLHRVAMTSAAQAGDLGGTTYNLVNTSIPGTQTVSASGSEIAYSLKLVIAAHSASGDPGDTLEVASNGTTTDTYNFTTPIEAMAAQTGILTYSTVGSSKPLDGVYQGSTTITVSGN